MITVLLLGFLCISPVDFALNSNESKDAELFAWEWDEDSSRLSPQIEPITYVFDTVKQVGRMSGGTETAQEDRWSFEAGVFEDGEEKSAFEINLKNVPKPSETLVEFREGGNPVVSLRWDGIVTYDTNKVDDATRKFWEVFSRSFPEMRRKIMWAELKEMIDEKEKSK